MQLRNFNLDTKNRIKNAVINLALFSNICKLPSFSEGMFEVSLKVFVKFHTEKL